MLKKHFFTLDFFDKIDVGIALINYAVKKREKTRNQDM